MAKFPKANKGKQAVFFYAAPDIKSALDRMVEQDNTDRTKWLAKMIREEWGRRSVSVTNTDRTS